MAQYVFSSASHTVIAGKHASCGEAATAPDQDHSKHKQKITCCPIW